MPQTPEIKEVRKSCTPENFRRAAESVEPTSWFAALMADRPWAKYENPGKFLCKVGNMYIYDIFDDVCSTALIYPHPAWANHDPAASALIRILSYLVELKCSVLCSIASSLQSSSKESLKKLMAQVDAECIALNDEISSVKNEVKSLSL
ncbi:hypothetical protein DL93DRAFT_783228 [Clavulina sp. PMI_390]|nr:hypothetical protein DL93DRAFT_783228 [Clavulina sp. PMI_390]